MPPFKLVSDFEPTGDQPAAVDALCGGLAAGRRDQVLLGVTGSGKTFTIANVVARIDRPTLVLAHNKTLAAQLYQEFSRLFPQNAVEYFVSYYDYYQPEAYVPRSDTYIEKEATINEEIDRMRHSATRALFERRDVLIVASVSCIYGLGSPEAYHGMMLLLERGAVLDRDDALRKLVEIQYQRTPADLRRGTFRVRGDTVEIWPSYAEHALRVEFWGDEIDGLSRLDPVRGKTLESLERHPVYPNSHYVTPERERLRAVAAIREELVSRTEELESERRLLEAQRLQQRTQFDLEMMQEVGYCHGIENYSRHLTARSAGEPPPTLMDYLPSDALLVIDESHVTLPQVRGMYEGDRSRKLTLVEHGFRLPSALDNRPLTIDEFEARRGQTIYVSATPGSIELGPHRRGGRRAARAADRAARSRDRRPPHRRAGGRPSGGDPVADARRRARAGDHADQAHGRGPHRVLSRSRRAGGVPALRRRHPRARPDPAGPAQGRVRRARGRQPAPRGASTCRRSRSSRFSTPTRRATSARSDR